VIRRLAGWLMSFFPDDPPKKRIPFACTIGWHNPKLRRDVHGYYVGCSRCDFADTLPIR
jgi:hypothetical protein